MKNNKGINRQTLPYFKPAPTSLVQILIQYFDTILVEEIQEEDLAIVQFIMLAYFDGKMPLFQVLYSWRSQVNYVYLLRGVELLRSDVQRVIDTYQKLLIENGPTMAVLCSKKMFDEKDFEEYLSDFGKQQSILDSPFYK